jgi:hypothetical protein
MFRKRFYGPFRIVKIVRRVPGEQQHLTARDAIYEYILQSGYDGLANDDCCCFAEELMPYEDCSQRILTCKLGHTATAVSIDAERFGCAIGDAIIKPGWTVIVHDTDWEERYGKESE